MAENKYGKYVVSNPKILEKEEMAFRGEDIEKYGFSAQYLSGTQVPGCPINILIRWNLDFPSNIEEMEAQLELHRHDTDEILLFMASGPDGDLGSDMEFGLGEEREMQKFNKTTAFYIPAGLAHGPYRVKDFDKKKPGCIISFNLQPEYDPKG